MIAQFSTNFMDKHAINCFSSVEIYFSIECSRSESMLSIFNSLQAITRKNSFSTVNRASVLALISFLGLLAVGRRFIKASNCPRVPWPLELLPKCLFHIVLRGRRETAATRVVNIQLQS